MKKLDIVVLMALFALAPLWRFVQERQEQKHLATCQQNIKELTNALHMYSCEDQGRYPNSLGPLEPTYLKAIPCCPSTNANYRFSRANVWLEPGWLQQRFTISCQGGHHRLDGVPVADPSHYYEDDFLIH